MRKCTVDTYGVRISLIVAILALLAAVSSLPLFAAARVLWRDRSIDHPALVLLHSAETGSFGEFFVYRSSYCFYWDFKVREP